MDAGQPRLDMRGQAVGALVEARPLLAPGLVDRLHHLDEARAAVARLARKVGAAPERLAVRRQEHGQRPAALLAHRRQRRHVDLVDVRPLLAIHLDIDEQTVHDGGDIVVLEAFVRHDMAPVAGGVADREQDRPVQRLCFGQRGRRPGPPMHRIAAVLLQIGAGFFGKQVLRRQCHDGQLGETVDRDGIARAVRQSGQMISGDSIVALSSGRLPAGIAVIRISGATDSIR